MVCGKGGSVAPLLMLTFLHFSDSEDVYNKFPGEGEGLRGDDKVTTPDEFELSKFVV